MSILDALADVKATWRPLSLSLPSISKTEHRMMEIVNAPPRPPKPPVDLEQVHQKLVTANSGGVWSGISPTEWRYASECLSMGQTKLISDIAFVDSYLGAMRSYGSPTTIRRLVRYYLSAFDRNVPGFRRIGMYLIAHLEDCGIWEERHKAVRLFDVDRAPSMLAEGTGNDPQRFLAGLGFTGLLSRAGIVAAAFAVACRAARQRLLDGADAMPELRRLTDWAAPDGKTFLFGASGEAKIAFAGVMLGPWGVRTPSDEVRDFVTANMVGLFRDPRIYPGNWAGIPPDVVAVMLRWLTKASLEQFLAVVDAIVAPEKKHQWDARRRFWSAFYDAGYMNEAWVVFGADGYSHALRMAQRGEPIGCGKFGKGEGAQRTHAVLLMEITGIVVADWSHDGSCHLWESGNQSAPRRYQPVYTRDELNSLSDFSTTHRGAWQTRVYDWFRGITTVRLPHNKYM